MAENWKGECRTSDVDEEGESLKTQKMSATVATGANGEVAELTGPAKTYERLLARARGVRPPQGKSDLGQEHSHTRRYSRTSLVLPPESLLNTTKSCHGSIGTNNRNSTMNTTKRLCQQCTTIKSRLTRSRLTRRSTDNSGNLPGPDPLPTLQSRSPRHRTPPWRAKG